MKFWGKDLMKKSTTFSVLLLTILSLLCSCSEAKSLQMEGTMDTNKPTSTELDRIVQTYVNEGQFSGSILVAKGDKVLLKKGYGIADYEKNISNAPETQFLIASVTKQFTALSIMQLWDEKKLSLDDRIIKYLPNLKKWGNITIRQLLQHTSGLPRNTPKRYEGFGHYSIQETELMYSPGSKFSYSNTGYFLLGCIVEKITGESLSEYWSKNVFAPLKMSHTGSLNGDKLPGISKGLINLDILRTGALFSVTSESERSTGYWSHNGLADVDLPDTRHHFGAGNIYSTVDDLFIWCQALKDGKLISKSAKEMLFTPGQGNYGFGWYIWPKGEWMHIGHKLVEHSGLIEGYTSRVCQFVDDDVVIIVLSNIENAPEEQLVSALAQETFDSTELLPFKEKGKPSISQIWTDYKKAAGENTQIGIQRSQICQGSFELNVDTLPITVMCKTPDKMSLELILPTDYIKIYSNGQNWRIENSTGSENMNTQDSEEWKDLFESATLMQMSKNYNATTLIGKILSGNNTCYVVEDKSSGSRIFFRSDTKMPFRIDRVVKSPLVQYIRTYYDDYKKVNGVLTPFSIRRSGWKIEFDKIDKNDTLEDILFMPKGNTSK
jgi:CubicO group peptidase (beta-lactamase class C family)